MDPQFKFNISRTPLFQFRVKNSSDYRYVKAATLHEASKKLERLGFEPDTLQQVGELVEENI